MSFLRIFFVKVAHFSCDMIHKHIYAKKACCSKIPRKLAWNNLFNFHNPTWWHIKQYLLKHGNEYPKNLNEETYIEYKNANITDFIA